MCDGRSRRRGSHQPGLATVTDMAEMLVSGRLYHFADWPVAEVPRAAAGERSLDARTRAYVQTHLSFRYATTSDGTTALELEHRVSSGELGPLPLLNPAASEE